MQKKPEFQRVKSKMKLLLSLSSEIYLQTNTLLLEEKENRFYNLEQIIKLKEESIKKEKNMNYNLNEVFYVNFFILFV